MASSAANEDYFAIVRATRTSQDVTQCSASCRISLDSLVEQVPDSQDVGIGAAQEGGERRGHLRLVQWVEQKPTEQQPTSGAGEQDERATGGMG